MSHKLPLKPRYGKLVPRGEPCAGKVVCVCDCGSKPKLVAVRHLRSGATKSCGCLVGEKCAERSRTHGMAARSTERSPEYRAWAAMNSRCTNSRDPKYKYYGGRGIKVWKHWRKAEGFSHFLQHVGPRPSAQHSLDRENNNLGYSPGNVRWATKVEQANNTRANLHITLDGRRQTLAQWCKELGRAYGPTWDKIYKRGWAPREALLLPSRM